MTGCKKPINRTLIKGSILFVVLICIIMGIQSYLLFKNALFSEYEKNAKHVINYIENVADEDDLIGCIKSKKTSAKYDILQEELNAAVDDFHVANLYIVMPGIGRNDTLVNLVSATSKEERSRGEKNQQFLAERKGFDGSQLAKYKDAGSSKDITFFKNDVGDESFHTGCKPIYSSKGQFAGLLCADLSLSKMNKTVLLYVAISLAIALVVGVLFILALYSWIRKNVTLPVMKLENSTKHFAQQSNENMDPAQLYFDVPEINMENEVQSLSATIEQMSYDIKNYVENIISAEERADSAEKEAMGMSRIAYQDALTRVKNKAAFDIMISELNTMISKNDQRFAIVMFDLNDLKMMNDKYGHNRGDEYLTGASKSICVLYKHSPVFRIGGDEFVAVLQGEDLENKDELIKKAREEFMNSSTDIGKPIWERYSCAIGMAVHEPGVMETAGDILKKADARMYKDKQQYKEVRKQKDSSYRGYR